MSNAITDLIQGGGLLGSAYAAYQLPEKGIEKLEEAQRTLMPKITQLGEDVAQTATFKPFSVRTGTGTTNIGQQGTTDVQVSQPLQALSQQLQGQAAGIAGQAPVTSQSLFDQMQAMRQGETERARLQLENRLAAQGRLGTQTAAFGGTPEALALEKALQEQQSADLFNAIQMAPQLEQARLANVGTALGTSFAPENQALAALQQGARIGELVQKSRQGQVEAQTLLGREGIGSEAELFSSIAGLEGARAKAFADALQGLFASGYSDSGQIQQSPIERLLSRLLGDDEVKVVPNVVPNVQSQSTNAIVNQALADAAMGR